MEIGIIGLGGMGRMYARQFRRAGFHVNACGRAAKAEALRAELAPEGIEVLTDGVAVSRRSDLIIYSMEADAFAEAAKAFGPSTKPGAIVAGQTSVKAPEIAALEQYVPKDVHIVTCHSMHGPTISPVGQTLIVIRHRATDEAYKRALEAFAALGSRMVEIADWREHDRIVADTQAVTHLAFECMGTAWKHAGFFPWENAAYLGGIDNVKVLIALRIFAGKWHVYGGIAMLNPFARAQVRQYAASESALFKMMIREDEKAFRQRITEAGAFVFGRRTEPIVLDDSIMGAFSMGYRAVVRKPNSHLSLLAMVDAWRQTKVNPYDNLICQTPPFQLRLGIAEYLFRTPDLLEESLRAALHDKDIRGDDLEFHSAVREWASIIEHGDLAGYRQQFEDTRAFFEHRLVEGMERSDELIQKLAAR